jgi:hypothetical protein
MRYAVVGLAGAMILVFILTVQSSVVLDRCLFASCAGIALGRDRERVGRATIAILNPNTSLLLQHG